MPQDKFHTGKGNNGKTGLRSAQIVLTVPHDIECVGRPYLGAPAGSCAERPGGSHACLRKRDDGTPFLAFVPNPLAMQARSAFPVGDRVGASRPPESNWAVADA